MPQAVEGVESYALSHGRRMVTDICTPALLVSSLDLVSHQPIVVEGRLPQGPYECDEQIPRNVQAISLGQQIELPDNFNPVHV